MPILTSKRQKDTQHFSLQLYIKNTVLDEKTLDEILTYLERSITNLAKDAVENLELGVEEGGGGKYQGVENFLKSQFEIRLENLLIAKNSSIHHLESGIKNKIIQRMELILEKISKQYQN